MSRRREQPKTIHRIDAARVSDLAAADSGGRQRWLWEGRIPLGALTVLDGDPGMGKSFITLDLAAHVTRHGYDMPDRTPSVFGGVVLLCAEDDPATTVQRRLVAANANLDYIYILQYVHGWNPNIPPYGAEDTWPVRLPSDIQALRTAITHVKARLVVIDPLVAFLDASAGSGREQDMYEALNPLARLAKETDVAMLLVRHLTKSRSRDPLHWGAGSLGIAGRVRAGLLAVPDPDDPERGRLLVSTKSNMGPPMPTLRYLIVASDADGKFYSDSGSGSAMDYARVQWLGPCDTTAATLKDENSAAMTASARAEAETFLRQALREGPRPANDVLAEAHAVGISTATLRRARAEVGVHAEREGFGTGGRWLWFLPPEMPDIPTPPETPGTPGWEEYDEEDEADERDYDEEDEKAGEEDDDWEEDDAVASNASGDGESGDGSAALKIVKMSEVTDASS